MRGPSFSFRIKLVAAMMMVVVGVTGATLYVAQNRMRAAHERMSELQFRGQVELFNKMRESRLSRIREKCRELVRSVRVAAALEEEDLELLYKLSRDELADVMRGRLANGPQGRARLIRFIDTEGAELPPPRRQARGPRLEELFESGELRDAFQQVARKMEAEGIDQKIGYIERVLKDRTTVMEVIVTKVVLLAEDEYMGALVLGFPMSNGMADAMEKFSDIRSGVWVNGELYSQTIEEPELTALNTAVAQAIQNGNDKSGVLSLALGGVPHKVFYQQMNDSEFLPAYQVALYSMAGATADQKDLRARIVGFGAAVLLGALVISLLISHGFSEPIRALVRGTHEIQDGNFDIRLPVRHRDEIGQLTSSFNEMAEGLAQKEKYQAVLDMVADKDVAEELMSGAVKLGGELRDISVLFCDIRGFTAMTQDMSPTDVIALMNDHFTLLTDIVYEHNGVVDKFVGDLIMGVFGAPRSYGNDSHNAARCCLRMIEERMKLNETAEQPIHMGIGLASGEAVAGCMGSENRLNYTVMGARVNLASRLCSVAGRNETVIDQNTYERLKDHVEVEPLPELKVKGFDAPVQAYKLLGIRSLRDGAESDSQS